MSSIHVEAKPPRYFWWEVVEHWEAYSADERHWEYHPSGGEFTLFTMSAADDRDIWLGNAEYGFHVEYHQDPTTLEAWFDKYLCPF